MSTLRLSAKLLDFPRFAGIEAISPRIAAKDPTIWGEAASAEAAIRLGWVDLPQSSRSLLPRLDALWAWARSEGIAKVILCGMGGSSLAPEVIARSHGKDLIVVDSTDPNVLEPLTKLSFNNCVVVVGSKSGTTIETRSQLALFEKLIEKSEIDPKERIIVITDPDSPLDGYARSKGYQLFNADPHVGGRFSALTAFGLVPSALLGIDIAPILDDASETLEELIRPGNQAELLASFMAQGHFLQMRESLKYPGLGDWVEQLVAESSGKEGKGILPWISETNFPAHPTLDLDHEIEGTLGSQFMLWEWSTSLLGWILKVDPFNQPNVEETKSETANFLNEKGAPSPQSIPIPELSNVLENAAPSAGYIAICAFLNRHDDHALYQLRRRLERRFNIPVTFGWGPRFLHSTGQFHKGGPKSGIFLSITGDCRKDVKVPGESFTFQELIKAQASGDAKALESKGLKVIQIHLKDRASGIEDLLRAFG
ncbi:MAG: glucose-6-phosphate isomerase [Actinomycetota bacterium]